MLRKWTFEHLEYLKTNYQEKGSKQLAKELPYTAKAIKSKANILGLTRNAHYQWTEEQIKYLQENYANASCESISQILGIKISIIWKKAAKMGLKKSKEYWKNLISEECKEKGKINRFRKGNIPFNKGLKENEFRSDDGIKKIKATQFKKGNKPINHKPVGSEIFITKHGKVMDIQVKVAEPNIWKSKRILLYEEHYGKVPEGALVVLIDGNPLNMVLENLMLIEKTYHGVRNRKGLKAYPKEIQEASLAILKLRKTIKIVENGKKT